MSEQKSNLCDGCALWPCGSHAPIGVDGCIATECANRKPTSGELIATLKAQRDELLAVVKTLQDAIDTVGFNNIDSRKLCAIIDAVIANAEAWPCD